MNVVVVLVDSLRKDHIGAYGNGWIETPNLDALAGESLRFTRAYPESIPSVPARRGVHTGLRSFPFRGWELGNVTEDDVALWGWEPIPEEQTALSEVLLEEGYRTLFVTDTLHQFRASYSFHRGFGVFEWVRGQERDLYLPFPRPATTGGACSPGTTARGPTSSTSRRTPRRATTSPASARTS